ncbi:ABC-type antimicrobial peptide transport system, permease component [Dyadobacter sp. SG02]|uniref:ABC transporter permease n=1 Tax=Dyadobacter sp. SG02 TaxID=1855291 RepID=UPI0008D72B77|nr:ABC transporter permease [Dyadobacter sp. SG02]SEI50575.1 ABC-type antimicrobial peptide transport system, permease component [Dyadobacter sp. SG02]
MLRNYLKVAVRSLLQNRLYAALNVFGLSLGITCALIIYMVVRYHLSFDNFHSNATNIYRVVTERRGEVVTYEPGVPAPLGKAFRQDYDFAEVVARTATFEDIQVTVEGAVQKSRYKEPGGVAFVEHPYFTIFHFPFESGNAALALSEPNTAVITRRLARKYFGNDNPINKRIRFARNISVRITGILKDLPSNSYQKTEIFVSYNTLGQQSEWLAAEDSWNGISDAMKCYVKLRPQVDPSIVERALQSYASKFRPDLKKVHHYKLQPLSEFHFDAKYGGKVEKKNLWILALIGLFLVTTACVNFINLATAQAIKRTKEVGVRKAMGGLRSQLFGQFITETALITIIAFVVATGITVTILPQVSNWFEIPLSLGLIADPYLAGFALLLVVLITLIAGSYPGIVASGFQPIIALKGKISHQNLHGLDIRRVLIIIQIVLVQALIMSMIVIIRQMEYVRKSDLGFSRDAIITLPIASGHQKAKTVKLEMEQINGVGNITLCYAPPASNDRNWTTTPYYDHDPSGEPFQVSVKAADADFIKTFGLTLIAGRNMSTSDSIREFIVNEAFVKKLNLASPENVLGKTLDINENKGLIVGVVRDFHDLSFHNDINPVAIFAAPDLYMAYAVKVNTRDLEGILNLLERIWRTNHPETLFEYEFLDDDLASFYKTEALMFKLGLVFAALAMAIGCLGLYGLISFMTARKKQEIGIRKVLGSTVGQIVWIFGKEYVYLIAAAFLIAAPVVWWSMQKWLNGFKFKIELGPGVLIWGLLATFVVAFLTTGYQAVRAALQNPIDSLQNN